ncbi:MAG: hypothetical protein AABX53_00555 [Nanoarchaeota archaeon]
MMDLILSNKPKIVEVESGLLEFLGDLSGCDSLQPSKTVGSVLRLHPLGFNAAVLMLADYVSKQYGFDRDTLVRDYSDPSTLDSMTIRGASIRLSDEFGRTPYGH